MAETYAGCVWRREINRSVENTLVPVTAHTFSQILFLSYLRLRVLPHGSATGDRSDAFSPDNVVAGHNAFSPHEFAPRDRTFTLFPKYLSPG